MVSNRIDHEQSPLLAYGVYDAFQRAEAETV